MTSLFQPKAGFTRWYDVKPELSQAVRMLEKMPATYQHQICLMIIEQAENAMVGKKFDGTLKKLGSDKILGLFKSKSKRRWYDEDPVVHKAFNYLFLMDDAARHETAMKIIIALNALKQFFANAEKQSLRSPQAANSTQTIITSIFDQPLDSLMQKTTLVALDLNKPAKPAPLPPPAAGQDPKHSDDYHIVNGMLLKKNDMVS